MLLKKIIKNLSNRIQSIEIEGLSQDSRQIKKNYLFFAIKGTEFNGEKYISDAISKGAKAVVCRSIDGDHIACIGENRKMLIFPITFIKVYLLRGLILSGWRGLVQSVVESFYAFLKEAYLWIIERESAGPDS